jgi:hypothetical protein
MQQVSFSVIDDVVKGGGCRHRLPIDWRATTKSLSDALPAEDIRIEFNIYHPIRTSVSMDTVRGEQLLKKLSTRFGSAKETQCLAFQQSASARASTESRERPRLPKVLSERAPSRAD